MSSALEYHTVTIANGAAVSSAARLDGRRLVGWLNPANLTNTAFDVQHSKDATNFYDITALKAVSVTVDEWTTIDPADACLAQYVRLQGSGNEAAERTIILVSMKIV
jgi:hypothetical protein